MGGHLKSRHSACNPTAPSPRSRIKGSKLKEGHCARNVTANHAKYAKRYPRLLRQNGEPLICVYPATVFVDDALHGGQAQAVPGKLLGSMQAVQHAEEFVPALHVKADAVVAYEIYNALLVMVPADGDEGGLARCAELERVVQ